MLAAFSSGAMAATECNGPPLSGTIPDGVVVNDGDFCLLIEATVYDSVQVNPGGILITCGSTIYGGIVANGRAIATTCCSCRSEPESRARCMSVAVSLRTSTPVK